MAWIESAAYLTASVLFILAFKDLSHPRTAVRGNMLGALGMLIAIVVTLFDRHILSYGAIAAGLAVGSGIGAALALKVRMTAMPQMVALLNGFGGGASVLVAGAALAEAEVVSEAPLLQLTVATAASGLIGAVTFWGSLVAYAKLEEFGWIKDLHFKGQHLLSGAMLVVTVVLGALLVLRP